MSFNEYRDDEEIHENRGWLPTWWMVLFWGAIVVSGIYAVYTHGIEGWSAAKQYSSDVAAYDKQFPPKLAALTEEGSNPYRGDAGAVERGKKSFETLCAACHKADLSGLVGPSLADAAWLHGSTDKEVFAVVMEGIPVEKAKQVPVKGAMPAHKNSLGPAKILEVLAYVASKNASLKAK